MCTPVLFVAAVSIFGGVAANVEKVIFTGPPLLDFSNTEIETIDAVAAVLTSSNPIYQTAIPVTFRSGDAETGSNIWFLLEQLHPQRRYEIRICWAATQPTSFDLNVFSASEVFSSSNLQSSLSKSAVFTLRDQVPAGSADIKASHNNSKSAEKSVAFLRVVARADYFTTAKVLMSKPKPVHVDLILDPYLLNLVPQSLVPTLIYLICIIVASWFLSGRVWKWLAEFNRPQKLHEH